uniref:Uncharacterized protein n=1 Tax=Hemiselmis andersenii TaxID=464988 RepID=A0A6U4J2P0_HEMAN|mmetsp:Transcript_58860/g.141929  ORF Transcript_58860/g.141929 Transcript_58860/m.141929 type:complete len:107 (+) Transcript_58860:88-408(+)
MFGDIRQLQELLGMGPPFLQDWVGSEEPSATRDWSYPVRDSDGAAQCYEFESIYLQRPDTQQFGCRGQFSGSVFRRVDPTPSGRTVCGKRDYNSGDIVNGCTPNFS